MFVILVSENAFQSNLLDFRGFGRFKIQTIINVHFINKNTVVLLHFSVFSMFFGANMSLLVIFTETPWFCSLSPDS